MEFPKDPREMTLREYCDCRDDMGRERRRMRPLSYGVHSTDAFIMRHRKYEKEYKALGGMNRQGKIQEGIQGIALEYKYDMDSEELSHKVIEFLHSQGVKLPNGESLILVDKDK